MKAVTPAGKICVYYTHVYSSLLVVTICPLFFNKKFLNACNNCAKQHVTSLACFFHKPCYYYYGKTQRQKESAVWEDGDNRNKSKLEGPSGIMHTYGLTETVLQVVVIIIITVLKRVELYISVAFCESALCCFSGVVLFSIIKLAVWWCRKITNLVWRSS